MNLSRSSKSSRLTMKSRVWPPHWTEPWVPGERTWPGKNGTLQEIFPPPRPLDWGGGRPALFLPASPCSSTRSPSRTSSSSGRLQWLSPGDCQSCRAEGRCGRRRRRRRRVKEYPEGWARGRTLWLVWGSSWYSTLQSDWGERRQERSDCNRDKWGSPCSSWWCQCSKQDQVSEAAGECALQSLELLRQKDPSLV